MSFYYFRIKGKHGSYSTSCRGHNEIQAMESMLAQHPDSSVNLIKQ